MCSEEGIFDLAMSHEATDAGQSARTDTSHKWVIKQWKILSSRAHQPNDKRATLKTLWPAESIPLIWRYNLCMLIIAFDVPFRVVYSHLGFRESKFSSTKNFVLNQQMTISTIMRPLNWAPELILKVDWPQSRHPLKNCGGNYRSSQCKINNW